jgi:glycerol kinase
MKQRLTLGNTNETIPMNAILALDQGTTSCRAMVFDRHANVLGIAQREFTQHFPQSGWVEHDANEIWRTQYAVALEAIEKSGVPVAAIAGIGITNQRETTVLWDRVTGEPIARAIVWQDRRTAAYCDELRQAGHEDMIRQKTGLIIDAYFSGTKLKWLLDNVPQARALAARGELAFGTVDSWLMWKLSGGKIHATDVSNASRTLLCNIHTLDWDDELLTLMNIPRQVLPEIVNSSGVVGTVSGCAGLNGLPIAGIAGDQQAALFGQACHHAGMAKNTYGTGCFMLMNTGTKPVVSKHRLLTTVAWRLPSDSGQTKGNVTHYALEGSVFAAGAAVQWLRDGLGIIQTSAEIESLAASVPDTNGVYVVPAFVGLGAPYWDPNARGTIFGLTRGITRAHIARATLESIAFQSAELANAMQQDAAIKLTGLRVDGGATVNNLLMQFQADVLQSTVARPKVTETTALGAAYLAGLAVGFWKNQTEIAELWVIDKTFTPHMSDAIIEEKMHGWHQAVQRSLGWLSA